MHNGKASLIVILIHLILLNVVVKANENEGWHKLFYPMDRKLNSSVMDSHYFLGKLKNSESELQIFKNAIIDSQNEEIKCTFPARYLWWTKKHNKQKEQGLVLCKDYQSFRKKLVKENISIVLTSEYFGSAISSFGHTFLVFHDQENPELLAPVINFSAEISEVDLSFWDYVSKGINKGFKSYFYLQYFFEKLDEYSLKENRSLNLFKLNVTSYEKEFLIAHLYEQKRTSFQYSFFKENCSLRLFQLLNTSLENLPRSKVKGYYLPYDLINDLNVRISNKGSINSYKSFIAQKKGSSEEASFHDAYSKFKRGEAVSNPLPKAKVTQNIWEIKKLKNVYTHSARITTGIAYDDAKKSLFSFGFRPVLKDFNDNQKEVENEVVFDILSFNAYYFNDTLKLNKLNLFRFQSISRIKGLLNLNFSTKSVIGRFSSQENLSWKTQGSAQLSSGGDYWGMAFSVGIGGDYLSKVKPYLPLELNLLIYLPLDLKVVGNYARHYYEQSFSVQQHSLDIIKYNSTYSYGIKYMKSDFSEALGLITNFYL